MVISVAPARHGIGGIREGGGVESQRRGETGGREGKGEGGRSIVLFSAFFLYFYPMFRFF